MKYMKEKKETKTETTEQEETATNYTEGDRQTEEWKIARILKGAEMQPRDTSIQFGFLCGLL